MKLIDAFRSKIRVKRTTKWNLVTKTLCWKSLKKQKNPFYCNLFRIFFRTFSVIKILRLLQNNILIWKCHTHDFNKSSNAACSLRRTNWTEKLFQFSSKLYPPRWNHKACHQRFHNNSDLGYILCYQSEYIFKVNFRISPGCKQYVECNNLLEVLYNPADKNFT